MMTDALRLFAVTLSYRRLGPAIKSWYEAQAYITAARPEMRLDWLHMTGNPPGGADGHDIVTAKYREAQTVFLAGPWDVFVAIEDDMIIPPDTFTRLLALLDGGAHIGYGLYAFRHGYPRWSAYTVLDERYGRSLSTDEELARAAWGRVIDVAGVGMGCTVIRREVLERFQFQRRGLACNDWYLAVDAQAAGLIQRCDCGLVCGHISLEPSPRVLWPDPDDPDLFRVEYLDPPDAAEQRRYAAWWQQREAAGLPVNSPKPRWLPATFFGQQGGDHARDIHE